MDPIDDNEPTSQPQRDAPEQCDPAEDQSWPYDPITPQDMANLRFGVDPSQYELRIGNTKRSDFMEYLDMKRTQERTDSMNSGRHVSDFLDALGNTVEALTNKPQTEYDPITEYILRRLPIDDYTERYPIEKGEVVEHPAPENEAKPDHTDGIELVESVAEAADGPGPEKVLELVDDDMVIEEGETTDVGEPLLELIDDDSDELPEAAEETDPVVELVDDDPYETVEPATEEPTAELIDNDETIPDIGSDQTTTENPTPELIDDTDTAWEPTESIESSVESTPAPVESTSPDATETY